MAMRQARMRLRAGVYSEAAALLMRGGYVVGEVVLLDIHTGSDGVTWARLGMTLPDDVYIMRVSDAGVSDEWVDARASDYGLAREAHHYGQTGGGQNGGGNGQNAGGSDDPNASGRRRLGHMERDPQRGAKANGTQPNQSSGRWRKPGTPGRPGHGGRGW